jgi:hypothetical protein
MEAIAQVPNSILNAAARSMRCAAGLKLAVDPKGSRRPEAFGALPPPRYLALEEEVVYGQDSKLDSTAT